MHVKCSHINNIKIFTKCFCDFVETCLSWKKPSFCGFILKKSFIKYFFIFGMTFLLSLIDRYVPFESMMVGDLFLIVQLNDCVEHNLQEWIQLGEYQPNIYHPYIGGGWQFCHDTKIRQCWHWMKTFWWPDEKSGGDQQDGQVDSDSSFKVDGFEEWSSIAHENQEEGGEVYRVAGL